MERLLSQRILKDFLLISFFTLLINLLIWLPYLLKIQNFYNLDFTAGFNTIYRNFDGLEYIIIAKTFYQPQLISALPQSLSAIYYASHFPGFALLILLFAPILGFLKSMIFVSLLFTALSDSLFYLLLRRFNLTSQPLYLSLVFLILPARWLITHSIGSAEPIFIFFTLLTFYFFLEFEQTKQQSKIYLASFFAALAQLTRPPGILIFLSLGGYLLWKYWQEKKIFSLKEITGYLWPYRALLVIPFTLLLVFLWYLFAFGDFFAYFHSGDNIHLVFPPYQVFNKNQFWVGDIWLEDILYIFFIGMLGGVWLFKQKLYPLSFFVLIYLAASTMVAHRDVSRYVLPVFPFVLIAFEKIITTKEFKIVLAIITLGIYLYAQNYLIANTAPFPNLQLFN